MIYYLKFYSKVEQVFAKTQKWFKTTSFLPSFLSRVGIILADKKFRKCSPKIIFNLAF